MKHSTLQPQRSWRAFGFLFYVAALLLACSNNNWQTQPAQPPAAVEQKSSLEILRQEASTARGSATAAIKYADAVADYLDQAGNASADADPGLAIELLEARAQQEPLRGADIDFARGRIEFALKDYVVAVATFEANARNRGHGPSATKVVQYHAAAGDRGALTTFCNEAFPLVRGGDDKNVFITECVSGMGYASPAEWSLISGPALTEYERWRAAQVDAVRGEEEEKAAAARAQQQEAAEAQRAETDKRNCVLRCAEKEALCKKDCYNDQCRRDCSDAEWACRRQC